MPFGMGSARWYTGPNMVYGMKQSSSKTMQKILEGQLAQIKIDWRS